MCITGICIGLGTFWTRTMTDSDKSPATHNRGGQQVRLHTPRAVRPAGAPHRLRPRSARRRAGAAAGALSLRGTGGWRSESGPARLIPGKASSLNILQDLQEPRFAQHRKMLAHPRGEMKVIEKE